jgi:hypothetical protein
MGGEAKGKMFEFQIGKQLRGNYSLYPLFLIGAFGCSLAAFQIVRTLFRSPDVTINKRDPKPYDKFITSDGKYVQYKYFSTVDYKKLADQNERPKLD